MAHEIEGNRMAYKGATPWHKIGVNVSAETTASGMLIAAGMNTTVALGECYAVCNGIMLPIPEKKAVVRSDGVALGVVGDRYQTVQNAELAEFCEALIGQGVNMETMGSLRGGRVVWAMGNIPNGHGVDPVQKNVLVASSHDGSMPVVAMMTPVRVVCNNTLSAALNGKHPNKMTIRHTASAQGKIDEAKKTVEKALEYFDRFNAVQKFLSGQAFPESELKKVVARTFGFKQEKAVQAVSLSDIISATEQASIISRLAESDKNRKSSRDANILNDIVSLYYTGMGTEIPGVKGSAWGAWNAVTEYLDHSSAIRCHGDRDATERRVESTWFGAIADKTQVSLDTILNATGYSFH